MKNDKVLASVGWLVSLGILNLIPLPRDLFQAIVSLIVGIVIIIQASIYKEN